MPTLRHSSSIRGDVREHVPLDHGDSFVEVGQYARGHQPAHARPEYDRMFPQFRHVNTMSPPLRAA